MNRDHPAVRKYADAVIDAAVRYVDEAICEQADGTLAAHLAAEEALVAAVRAFRSRTAPRPRWDGPGIYRILVTDQYGAHSADVAVVDEDEMLEAFWAQHPQPDQVTDVILVAPLPGADR